MKRRTRLATILDAAFGLRPFPPEDEEFAERDHTKKVKKDLYKHRPADESTKKVRRDIPSSIHKGIEVVTVHDGKNSVLGFDHSATIENVEFKLQPAAVEAVGAKGEAQRPFAYMVGTVTDEKAVPRGIRLWYNPRATHTFVEHATMRPVKSADKVYQIGKHMFAQGITYHNPKDVPAPEGMKSQVNMNTYE